jgi:ribosomal-protein-alanine N-acetyltransferase
MPLPIRTPRLVIRPPLGGDAPALAAFQRENEAHLTPWAPPRPAGFYTEAWWERRAAESALEHLQGSALRLTIWLRNGELVGCANFTRIARGPFLCASLGYEMGQRYEGQGLMFEALDTTLQMVFDEIDLHRIEANHRPENVRSARLLRRLRFDVQGYARDYLYIDGAWRDHVLTARTNPRAIVPAVG